MRARDPAEVIDLLLKFPGDGERWVKGRWSDRRGNRCLLGALDFVGSHHAINGEAAEHYLADEVSAVAERDGYIGDCARFRASLRRAISGDIGPARLCCGGTAFPISTMGVVTLRLCRVASAYSAGARRAFERRFNLADHMKVTGANIDNGMLHVDLVHEVPEAAKPRKIAIGTSEPVQPQVTEQKAAA
ncbi:MAG: Hsp20 family protein [Stellaceae bacterium]